MSITFNMHTQRTIRHHEFESKLFLLIQISVHGCFQLQLSALFSMLYALFIIILQLYNEGVYIPFPSCALKLSNLELNSIYLHSLHIKAPIYYGRERIAQGPFTIIQACLHLMTSLIFQNIFKKCAQCFSSCLLSLRCLAAGYACMPLRCSCINPHVCTCIYYLYHCHE
jgi:hypothetical protein